MKKYWMVMTYQPGRAQRYEKIFCGRKDWADQLAAENNLVAKFHSVVCEVYVLKGFLKPTCFWPWEVAKMKKAT